MKTIEERYLFQINTIAEKLNFNSCVCDGDNKTKIVYIFSDQVDKAIATINLKFYPAFCQLEILVGNEILHHERGNFALVKQDLSNEENNSLIMKNLQFSLKSLDLAEYRENLDFIERMRLDRTLTAKHIKLPTPKPTAPVKPWYELSAYGLYERVQLQLGRYRLRSHTSTPSTATPLSRER
jgi:hypothetical protein